MFRRSWMLLVLGVTAAPLHGQDSLIARLRSRADSLLRGWRESRALAELADSLELERAKAGRDTIAVGSLRIIANRSPLPLRAAAQRAWPAIDSLYGTAAADLAHRPYFVRAVDPDPAVRRQVLHVGLELPWDLDVQATTNVLIGNVPVEPLDGPLKHWLGGVLRPALREREERATIFVQLVTAPSQAVRSCFLGDIARCKDALQLGDTSGLLERWYATPPERRMLVVGAFSDYFNRGASAPLYRRCAAHSDTACTMLLRSLPSGTLPRPLHNAARLTLVREALRVGGRDAYRRLTAAPAEAVHAQLARASGIGIDSLIARWRQAILAARPVPVALPWWAGVAAGGWTVVFAVCALRSARWRL